MLSRKLLTSTFAALTLGAAALASAPASAGPIWKPYPKYYGGYYGGGYMAAGLIGGMALGAMAASAHAAPVYEAEDCYTVRRKVHTPYGLLIRKVRVCE
ncbi:MAG TPA: hypothetical protein VGU24_20180 [Microvirga sp.]|jgi:hypothetical protein|nr:hypothetical protein [Microvirga sp.]